MENGQKTILIVDDERLNINLLVNMLKADYTPLVAKNGKQAIKRSQTNPPPDLILLDIMMPEMDGWDVCKLLKREESTRDIPIIMQTALDSSEDFQRGIELGAYYFLTKPIDPIRLLPLVRSALEERQRFQELCQEVGEMDVLLTKTENWKIQLGSLDDALSASKLVSKACPDPEAVALGLSELLINAIEHGVLGISYDEKTILYRENTWLQEVKRRSKLSENAGRFAVVDFQRLEDRISIRIEDPGAGFDWRDYLEFSAERATDSHGRGIAMSNASLDIAYSEQGNVVTINIRTP